TPTITPSPTPTPTITPTPTPTPTITPTPTPTVTPSPTPVTSATYNGGTGNWSNPDSWNPAVVPNNGNNGQDYNANMSGGLLIQDISPGVTIQQFQMSGGTLQLDNPLTLNAGLQFSGGTIQGGNLFIAGTSNQSALMSVNATTINNSGTYNISLDG